MKLFGIRLGSSAKAVLLVGFISALGVGSLRAQVYTDTLADLMDPNGTYNSLTIDDKTFSQFNIVGSGLTSFDPANIIVTAYVNSGIEYLTWSGNISFTGGGPSTADLLLNYVVTSSAGSIDMIDQAYTGTATGNGLLAISETVATGSFGGTVVGSSQLSNYDLSDPPAEFNDYLTIQPPQTLLYVTKDIALAIPNDSLTLVTVSQVTQSFHQIPIPEPATLLLGSLGGALLLVLRCRCAAGRG
jgi:hypothetical protein